MMNRKQRIPRIISWILSVSMILSLMPNTFTASSAAAEEINVNRTNEGVVVENGQDATTLAKQLVGNGIQIQDAKTIYADESQVGVVTNGEPLFDVSGVALSSGNLKNCITLGRVCKSSDFFQRPIMI